MDLFFRKGEDPLIKSYRREDSETVFFEIGYVVKDSYCILLVKSEESQISPVVSDLLGTGLFMPTPSKETRYSLSDYEIKEESEIISLLSCFKKERTYTNPLRTTACRLVLEAAFMGKGNEIFVFDMGTPVKIADLARRMIELAYPPHLLMLSKLLHHFSR